MTRIRRLPTAILLFALIAGCTSGHDSTSVPSPDGTFSLQLPARWAGHYRVDSLSTGERGTARPGAMLLLYLPTDTAVRSQALLAVGVYDSAAWAAVRAEQGPPPGDSVLARGGRVYVVAQPQSNPFAGGSPDWTRFAALELKPEETRTLFQLH